MLQEKICNIKGGGRRKLPESLGQPWVGPGLQEVIDDPQLKSRTNWAWIDKSSGW